MSKEREARRADPYGYHAKTTAKWLRKNKIAPHEIDKWLRSIWNDDVEFYLRDEDHVPKPSYSRWAQLVHTDLNAKRPRKPRAPSTPRQSSGNTHQSSDAQVRAALRTLQHAKKVPEPGRFARAVARAKEALRRFHR